MITSSENGQQFRKSTLMRRVRLILVLIVTVSVVCLAIVGVLAEKLLNDQGLKARIQHQIAAASGISFDYRNINIDWFPVPVLELQGLTLTTPGTVKGEVAAAYLRPNPRKWLTGVFAAGELELEQPNITVTSLDSSITEKRVSVAPSTPARVSTGSLLSFAGLEKVDVEIAVNDGRFTASSGTGELIGEGVSFNGHLTKDKSQTMAAELHGSLNELTVTQQGKTEHLQTMGLNLDGKLHNGRLAVQLEQLVLVRPAFTLTGSLAYSKEGVQLELTGNNIDVDAVRKTAMGIAGAISPIPEIFSHLVGGTVPQLNFSAAGASFSELGDYQHFHLEGQLQHGRVAVPEIGLDLREVAGDCRLADGVLRGSNLSVRLEKATGYDGTLALGLAEESDLFSLEMLLHVDLAEGREILSRLARDTTFAEELDQITMLEGTGTGKLILGDTFSDLGVKVEGAVVESSFRHTALPFPVSIDGGPLDYASDSLSLQDLHGTLGRSRVSGVSGTVSWQKMVQLDIGCKTSQLVVDELFPWLKTMAGVKPYLETVRAATGKVLLDAAHYAGVVDRWNDSRYGISGTVEDAMVQTSYLPAEVKIPKGVFVLDDQQLVFQQTQVASLDSDLRLKGTIREWNAVEVTADGKLGSKSVDWLESVLKVPAKYSVRTPLTFSGMQMFREKNGEIRFVGDVAFAPGPVVSVDVTQKKQGINVEKLQVKGVGTELVELQYRSTEKNIKAGFNGELSHKTLDAIFAGTPFAGKGLLKGDIRVDLPDKHIGEPTASGTLIGSGLQLPLAGNETLGIEEVALNVQGTKISTKMQNLRWRDVLFNPVRGTVELQRGKVAATVEQAEVCSIPLTGTGRYAENSYEIDISIEGQNLHLDTIYTCLTKGRAKMTGSLGVTGQVATRGSLEQLFAGLDGPLEMHFANGVIKQDRALAAVLEVLNVTEIVKGRLPALTAGGFLYHSIEMKGRFHAGKLVIDKIMMDGETLNLLGSGYIDLDQGTVQVELLAAPFKTVDSIIHHIPVVNYLLGGSLVAIPLSVTGKLENPKVRVMSLSSVSKSLLDLGERTIKLPFKLFQSIIPEE